jgi:peptide-methionine (S)-S-oxide reductase
MRRSLRLTTRTAALVLLALVTLGDRAAAAAADAREQTDPGGAEVATFGGGCFWCLEAVFERVEGVESVVSGYAGGQVPNPSYKQVSTGRTGHAEVVQVHFDPRVIAYEDLLELFFAMHDPTTEDRQGADVGPQYRSLILAHDERQRQVARSLMERLEQEEVFPDPIVTELDGFDVFYRAADHHQDYYEKNPGQGYCRVVIAPKVNELREKYTDRLKPSYR